MTSSAYFLIGATASGKTEVAHVIARRTRMPILSIDSMQIYKGMDVGTAKPTPEERDGIVYYGIDIVEPDADFSLLQFCSYVSGILQKSSGDLIVCGGTGLYAKALTQGLEDGPPPDSELREKWERMIAESGIDSIRQELMQAAPEVYESLKDKDNPRRLIRALERAQAGESLPGSWAADSGAVLTGLDVPSENLKTRIDVRAEKMFAGGIVRETQSLLARYGGLSRTASQAIGYAEALAMLDGQMTEAQAIEKTRIRTRQLAKKQRTWFRHQAEVDWIDGSSASDSDALADLVMSRWDANGSVEIKL